MESDLVPGIHTKQTKVRRSNNALGQGSCTGSLATVTDWRRRSLHAVVLLKNMFSLRCFFSFKYFTTKRSQQESLSPLSKQPVKIQVYEQKILKFTSMYMLMYVYVCLRVYVWYYLWNKNQIKTKAFVVKPTKVTGFSDYTLWDHLTLKPAQNKPAIEWRRL